MLYEIEKADHVNTTITDRNWTKFCIDIQFTVVHNVIVYVMHYGNVKQVQC